MDVPDENVGEENTPQQNTITGTSGDDVLQADDDGDRIEGGGGDDSITGGAGWDALYGGVGNDTITGGEGQDWIEGGEGNDELDGGEGADFLGGGGGNDTLRGGAEADSLAGHEGDDVLYGGEGNDMLEGGAGADTISGGTGDDEMYGDAGADTFVFAPGHGNDVVYDFTSGEDKIELSFNNISSFDDLTITSSDDGVTIDLTEHGGGTIFLEGFTADNLDADDFIFATSWEYGTGSNDRILGDATAENIDGLGGDDTVFGGADNDKLIAGSGTDELFGGAGADSLNGGLGDDTLTGGADADTFYFNGAFGTDTITDFTDGEDAIDLTAITGITGFEDLTISADGTDAVIDLTSQAGGTIRLEGFDVADLDADDFNFYDPSTQESEIEGICGRVRHSSSPKFHAYLRHMRGDAREGLLLAFSR